MGLGDLNALIVMMDLAQCTGRMVSSVRMHSKYLVRLCERRKYSFEGNDEEAF